MLNGHSLTNWDAEWQNFNEKKSWKKKNDWSLALGKYSVVNCGKLDRFNFNQSIGVEGKENTLQQSFNNCFERLILNLSSNDLSMLHLELPNMLDFEFWFKNMQEEAEESVGRNQSFQWFLFFSGQNIKPWILVLCSSWTNWATGKLKLHPTESATSGGR